MKFDFFILFTVAYVKADGWTAAAAVSIELRQQQSLSNAQRI